MSDSAFSAEPIDFGSCPDDEFLLDSSSASPSAAAQPSVSRPASSDTEISTPRTSQQEPTSCSQPSSGPEVIELSSDDDEAERVTQSPRRIRKNAVVKQEPEENSENCQETLKAFMANKESTTRPLPDHVIIDCEDDESGSFFTRKTTKIKKEPREASSRGEVDVNMTENAETNFGQQLQNDDPSNEENPLFFPEAQSPASPPGPEVDTDHHNESAAAYQPADLVERGLSQPFVPNSHRPQSTRGRGCGATRGGRVRTKASTDGVPKSRGQGTRKRRARGEERSMFQMQSLLPYDVSSQIRRNQQAPDQPRFTSTRKAEALKELIASIPEPQRALHHQDKSDLERATRKFKGVGAVKPGIDGKWAVRGMKTQLHSYQILGCARMRDNEAPGSQTRGGILADEMGLGKTIMALANIINGSPDDATDPQKATLIVAPASLTTQWYEEIRTHVDPEKCPKLVMIYRSSSVPYSSNPEGLLGMHDIVITSYNELNKSMPNNKPPLSLTTEVAKREWFEEHFKKERGALHKVKWLRVVLDEAHAIKNHESKTSLAASRLQAKYRWALSGTPVQNSLLEFFAYFRFLRARSTGNFELFKKNYCKRGSEKALERLKTRLEAYIIRRTHQDTLFGRPIIKLPPLEERTIELEFSQVERNIYDIVNTRFQTKVREHQTRLSLSQNSYTVIYVLLLRLRQLTAHVLLIEKTLNDLLEAQDLDQLWELTRRGQQAEMHENDKQLLRGLEMALKVLNGRRIQQEMQRPEPDVDAAQPAAQIDAQPKHELSDRFHEYLAGMRNEGYVDMASRLLLCHLCHNPPTNPHVTSCRHIYCFSCLADLVDQPNGEDGRAGTCVDCNEEFSQFEALAPAHSNQEQAPDEDQSRVEAPASSRQHGADSGGQLSSDWYRQKDFPLSTKMRAAVEQMEKWFAVPDNGGQGNKVLVFSQFRDVLKALSTVCREKQWDHQLFHGEIPMEARKKAIHTFTTDKKCKVLLAGLKAGGVGLNLTAANKVILIDLWWNMETERQAFFRVSRIGQERACEVVRFAVKSSIDAEMLLMQERKAREIALVMGHDGARRKLTSAELLRLFGDDGVDANFGSDDEGFIMPDDPYEDPDEDDDDDTQGRQNAASTSAPTTTRR